jgi:predicted aspartyl protease
MTQLHFDPNADSLIFHCQVEHHRTRMVWLVLDTGASTTILRESVLHDIGYSPEDLTEFVSFGDASQSHTVPKIVLKSFSLATANVKNLEVLCYSLPEEYGIDGVVGLNFLRHFNLFLNFEQGILTLNKF